MMDRLGIWFVGLRGVLKHSFNSPVTFDSHSWLSVDASLRALAALALCACTLLFSVRVVRWALPRAGLPLRWTAILSFGAWTATVGFHVLRALGLFSLPFALIACGGLAAVALRHRPEVAPPLWALRREARALRLVTRRIVHGPYALFNALFLCVGVFLLLRSLIMPPVTWDTLVYHGTRAALWVQSGQFTFDPGPGTFAIYRNFPAGGEVLIAWSLLPFHSDLLVNFGTFVTWLWLGLAVWALARAYGLREPFAGSAVAVCIFIPTLMLEVCSGYVEIVLYAALFSAFALALEGIRRPRPGLAPLAGMAAGVAVGVKFTVLPPAALALLALGLAALIRGGSLGRSAAGIAMMAGAAMAPALPGILFAWHDTGYPLSSMPVSVLGHTLGVADPQMQWIVRTLDRPSSPEFETSVLRYVFAPIGLHGGEALGALAMIPLVAWPAGVVARVRRQPAATLLMVTGLLVMVAGYFSQALMPVRVYWPDSSSRFLVGAVVLAVVLSLGACRGGPVGAGYRLVLLSYPFLSAFFLAKVGVGGWERLELLALAVALAVVGGLVRWATPRWRRTGIAGAIVAYALLAGALQCRRDATRLLALQQSFAMHPTPTYWAPWLNWVDTPPKVNRIAVTGGSDWFKSFGWFMYPFLGRRLQNEVTHVPATRDGTVAHLGPFGDLATRMDLTAWDKRLGERDINYVLTYPPRSPEQNYMEQAGETRFRKLAGDLEFGLFERIAATPRASEPAKLEASKP